MSTQNPKTVISSVATAFFLSLGLVVFSGGQAPAEELWNFYMHQSAPNFATSRGAQLFTEEIEKATNGELKVRLHLAGTLQINASNITQAVGENVVQMGDFLDQSSTNLGDVEEALTQMFRIVGEDEADPSCGTVSYVSPLASAVLGNGPGDTVQIPGDTVQIAGAPATLLDVH